MGAVKTDIHAKSRNYNVTYAVTSAKGVRALLRDRHRIAERRYKGDTAASDIIIDLHSAIESAGLTDRQAEAIGLVYGMDITQTQAARIMGISQKNVSEYLDIAVERIAAVYKRWNYEEITVAFEKESDTIDAV